MHQNLKLYLQNKADIHEKTVNLLLDEIHVNYKAGHLIDMSENSKFEATTIQIYHNFTDTLPVHYFFSGTQEINTDFCYQMYYADLQT